MFADRPWGWQVVLWTLEIVWWVIKYTAIVVGYVLYFLFWIMLGWFMGAAIAEEEERRSFLPEMHVSGSVPEDSATAAIYRQIGENAMQVNRPWSGRGGW